MLGKGAEKKQKQNCLPEVLVKKSIKHCSISNKSLKHRQGQDIYSFLGHPVPGSHHPLTKVFLLHIKSKFLLFKFKKHPPCPINIRPCKKSLSHL